MTGAIDGLDLVALRDVAHALADAADEITMRWFDTGLAVEHKDDGTPVTAADRQVERTIRTMLAERLPGHAMLGEEDGRVGDADAPLWVVDPIDGTKNFARGNPVWATLVALVVDDVEVLGVVSAPALGTRWDGVAGGPARRDGRPVHVSAVDRLDRAEVSFGGLNHFVAAGLGQGVLDLSAASARQRGFGDFWQHCLVASGQLEAALEATVSRWDLAAVRAVVEAAGGRFSDLDGVATTSGGSALSSNGHVHDAVLATLHGHRGAGEGPP